MIDLDALERLAGEATGGAWWPVPIDIGVPAAGFRIVGRDGPIARLDCHGRADGENPTDAANAAFIAAARTAIPELVDEVRRLREGVAEAGVRMTVEGEQEWCIGAHGAPRYSLNTVIRNLLAGKRWDGGEP